MTSLSWERKDSLASWHVKSSACTMGHRQTVEEREGRKSSEAGLVSCLHSRAPGIDEDVQNFNSASVASVANFMVKYCAEWTTVLSLVDCRKKVTVNMTVLV